MPGGPLRKYYMILDGEEKANYLRAKDLMIDVDLGADDDKLWEAHKRALASDRRSSGRISLLDLKHELAKRDLESCKLCERRCGANRKAGKKGHCGVLDAHISSEFLHMGEEPELVPSYTIFFSGCTFNCVFCQNWDISTRPGSGVSIRAQSLARMIESKALGRGSPGPLSTAKNVNWVGGDPTSNLPFILDVLRNCSANLPQVWNSNMYLSEDGMNLLDGVIDVYLTDFKYGNDKCALRLSNAPDYMRIVGRNHRLARANGEMIIRHLVLPGHIECCTREVLKWISENLEEVKVNVMGQYRPEHRARDFDEISKPLRIGEYKRALEIAESFGLDLTG